MPWAEPEKQRVEFAEAENARWQGLLAAAGIGIETG
jgi:hypothetical protein